MNATFIVASEMIEGFKDESGEGDETLRFYSFFNGLGKNRNRRKGDSTRGARFV
jgi:hypothetical protein